MGWFERYLKQIDEKRQETHKIIIHLNVNSDETVRLIFKNLLEKSFKQLAAGSH